MRCGNRGGLAFRDGRGERGVLRNRIERIGIEHERDAFGDCPREQRLRGGRDAQSRTTDDRARARRHDLIRGPQHQLRLAPVDRGRTRRGQSDPYLAGAGMQRGASRQQRRADHAVRAADDRERAERSLVHVARLPHEHRRTLRGEAAPVQSMAARRSHRFGVEIERMNRDGAAAIEPVARQQSRLQRDERGGRRRADDRAARNTGVGVDSAGNIEREYRNAGRVGAFDLRHVLRVERTGETDAEQSIDDQRSAPSGWIFRHRGSAGIDERAIRLGRVLRQASGVAAKHDGHVEEAFPQPARQHESIAAVVAGSCQHEDRSVALAEHRPRDIRRGRSRAVHQRCAAGRRFDAAQIGGAVNRK